jgi:hypothetical protein
VATAVLGGTWFAVAAFAALEPLLLVTVALFLALAGTVPVGAWVWRATSGR